MPASKLFCGNNDKSPDSVDIMWCSDKKYCHIVVRKDRVCTTSRGGNSNIISYDCLDVSGYNLFFNYKENDKVIWWDLHRGWNQSWILKNTGTSDSFYIKDNNDNLYLCYGDNKTMFLSKKSPNRIILKKSY